MFKSSEARTDSGGFSIARKNTLGTLAITQEKKRGKKSPESPAHRSKNCTLRDVPLNLLHFREGPGVPSFHAHILTRFIDGHS